MTDNNYIQIPTLHLLTTDNTAYMAHSATGWFEDDMLPLCQILNEQQNYVQRFSSMNDPSEDDLERKEK